MSSPAPVARPSLFARARKAIVAIGGTVAMVVVTKVLEEDVEVVVNALLALGTAAGVYGARNAAERNLYH